MARAKHGGTRSLLRGYVGQTLYQVTQAPSGAYVQLERAKEQAREYSNTDPQALNRMLMGSIEMAMATCKTQITDTFEGAQSKSIAYQMFSAYNYKLIQQDAQAHWDGGNLFDYPWKSQKERKGGYFIVGYGSLEYSWQGFYNGGSFYEQFQRFSCLPLIGAGNMAEFTERNKITPGDILKCFYFKPDYDSKKGTLHSFYVNVSQSVKPSDIISESNVGSIFSVYGHTGARLVFFPDNKQVCFQVDDPQAGSFQDAELFAVVLLRRINGRLKCSYNRLTNRNKQMIPVAEWATPYNAFTYSWSDLAL